MIEIKTVLNLYQTTTRMLGKVKRIVGAEISGLEIAKEGIYDTELLKIAKNSTQSP